MLSTASNRQLLPRHLDSVSQVGKCRIYDVRLGSKAVIPGDRPRPVTGSHPSDRNRPEAVISDLITVTTERYLLVAHISKAWTFSQVRTNACASSEGFLSSG